jgi:hypothetical protein
VHPLSSCKWFDDEHFSPKGVNEFTGTWHRNDVAWRYLLCGIDRFNLTNTNGLRDLDIRLYRSSAPDANGDLTQDTETTCQAFSIRPDGSVSAQVDQTTRGQGPYRMDWNGALNMSVPYGSYSVLCLMPKNTRLINILQREY